MSIGIDDLCSASSLNSLRSRSTHSLDSWVSKWERLQVERNLHIYFQNDYTERAVDVYRNIGIPDMDEEQKGYLDKVKNYLKPIDGRIATVDKFKFYPEKILAVLDQISEELCQKEEEESIRLRVMKFIRVLTNLVVNVNKRKQVHEGSFTKLVASFAEMCCLHPEFCFPNEDQSVWKNLYGIKEVISQPDIRLFKHGIITKPEARTSSIVASVIEVKKDSMKEADDLEMQRIHLINTHSSASKSSFGSVDSEGTIPNIEDDLNKSVLGHHAGELFLDLYEFYREVDVSTMNMPGMIVDGPKIYLTLLEISSSHFRKLKRNQDIDTEDKATIYYSKPLNIFQDDERCTLMEIFIRLNNIEYNTSETNN